jgi:hypothetical protein
MHVKTFFFFNGDLDEVIYMEQFEAIVLPVHEKGKFENWSSLYIV